jgi:hypothetical protein
MVFSDNLELVREIPSTFRANQASTIVLDDGRVLTTENSRERPDQRFHILDLSTNVVSSIGKKPPSAAVAPTRGAIARDVAYGGGDTFWVGPEFGAGEGYKLELWNTSGTLLRTVVRSVDWFPAGSDSRSADGRRPSTVSDLTVDDTGLLYVHLSIVTDRWKPTADAEALAAMWAESVDQYIEVIDPHSGIVLASEGPTRWHPDQSIVWLPRTRFGYSGSFDQDGFYRIGILAFKLVPK